MDIPTDGVGRNLAPIRRGRQGRSGSGEELEVRNTPGRQLADLTQVAGKLGPESSLVDRVCANGSQRAGLLRQRSAPGLALRHREPGYERAEFEVFLAAQYRSMLEKSPAPAPQRAAHELASGYGHLMPSRAGKTGKKAVPVKHVIIIMRPKMRR